MIAERSRIAAEADRWRARAVALLVRSAHAVGVDIVARNYYSPIPAWEDLPAAVFERRSSLTGIRFDVEAQLRFLGGLKPFLAEFDLPPGFTWDNRMYDRVEADVLYAIIRSQRPSRIIELGSGFSSLIIAAAARRNIAEGSELTYTAYDPYARDFIRAGAEPLVLCHQGAGDVPVETFAALQAGDVLFVDTTHTVKLGSEVNHIILDVLPTLAPGVIVHVHDVFLPYEYPKEFLESRLYWAEQYVLQAFLSENDNWEILLPLGSMSRDFPAEMAKLVPSFRSGIEPGAFWMRRAQPADRSAGVVDLANADLQLTASE